MRDGKFGAGNRLWEVRSSAGPKPTFATPEALWAACVEYFVWSTDNPLAEAKVFPMKDELRVEFLPKMRSMSIGSMCLFIDVAESTWREWRAVGGPHYRPDLSTVMERVEAIIYETQFSAAAVGLVGANIVAQKLGLSHKHEVAGKDGGPIQHTLKARVIMVPPKKPATVETRPMGEEEA